jgi:hypothetical protein
MAHDIVGWAGASERVKDFQAFAGSAAKARSRPQAAVALCDLRSPRLPERVRR